MHEIHRDMAADVRATHALRLGLREIKGLAEDDAKLIVARRHRGYDSLRDLWLRTGLKTSVLERLADADAFGSLGLARRDALWAAKALGRAGGQDDLPLFAASTSPRGAPRDACVAGTPLRGEVDRALARSGEELRVTGDEAIGSSGAGHRAHPPLEGEGAPFAEPEVDLPPMPLGEEVVNDYRFLKLSLRAHPAAFLRGDLEARRIMRNEELRQCKSGARVRVSGLITVRQRPGSANGVIFMTIEDETAIANVIVWPKMFERFRPIVLGARYVAVSGRMQEECGVIHVVADRLDNLTPLLARLADSGTTIEGLARCDEVKRPGNDQRSREIRAGRKTALVRLLDEMPELIGDLDVQARATRHVIAKPRRTG
ncbi:MAG: OB-fold nucleic acid binding domain-containing protein [Xanthobacteraceae bacterium]